MFDIVEKFITISGEAPIMGEPIYLIRFSKCNLDCTYCDTSYKNEINETILFDDLKNNIIEKVNEFPELKILFTGGEPLLDERQDKILSLIEELKYINFYIETNGSIKINNFKFQNSHFIVDWKSSSSNFESDFCIDNLKLLRMDKDCIKFVISYNDLDWLKSVIKIIDKVNPFLPLYISPQAGKIKLSQMADFIIKNRYPLKMSFQFHKLIWPDKERGV